VAQRYVSDTTAGENSVVRGHAFAALGKLCLCDAALARRCAPSFVRELQTAQDAVVRNNVLMVMCDLCRRHTSLVDQHVPALASCLCDPNVTVRRHSLALLSHLIHLDYLKLKGSTFYYLLLPLADQDQGIRTMAEGCLEGLMKRKDTPGTSIAASHFVEAMFFLNSCTAHSVYNKFEQEGGSALGKHLSGARTGDRTRRRHAIYKVLLQSMADEHKFVVAGKIAQEVMGAIVDGVLEIKHLHAVMADAFWVLGCKDIRLAANRGRADESEEGGAVEDPASAANAAVAAAKGKLISKIARKNLLENTVPIVIGLKAMLEKEHSPLVGELMHCLQQILKEYKSEAADLFAADPRLASEIEYDLRRPLTPMAGNVSTPLSMSAAKGSSARRRQSAPASLGRCVTPGSRPQHRRHSVTLPSPSCAGSVRKWNVVPTPGSKAVQVEHMEESTPEFKLSRVQSI